MEESIFDICEKSSHLELVMWAQDCAYHVLSYFEKENPNDLRPRDSIETITRWIKGELSVGEVRKYAFSAHAAARDTLNEKAMFAARAAGHAAATVHVKTHAIHASHYAIKIFSFSEIEAKKEYLWQYKRLIEIKKRTIK